MKKIIIPTILTATILIAGMFAFMPVEKVTSVHTTAGATQVNIVVTPECTPRVDANNGSNCDVVAGNTAVTYRVLVTRNGVGVTGLLTGAFAQTVSGTGEALAALGGFAEVGNGVYTFTQAAGDADFGADNDLDQYQINWRVTTGAASSVGAGLVGSTLIAFVLETTA